MCHDLSDKPGCGLQGGAKVQEAFYIYQELGDKFTWTVRLHNGLAVCQMRMGRWEEAEAELLQVCSSRCAPTPMQNAGLLDSLACRMLCQAEHLLLARWARRAALSDNTQLTTPPTLPTNGTMCCLACRRLRRTPRMLTPWPTWAWPLCTWGRTPRATWGAGAVVHQHCVL